MCVRHGVFMEVREKKEKKKKPGNQAVLFLHGWGLRAKLRATRFSSMGCDVISATPGEFLDMGSLTQVWGVLQWLSPLPCNQQVSFHC